ncbi:DUF6003 family protein [Streptomyces smyrnaeus]|uniref:DUF6003 family protein n=1 Tax=Streptomyces smyrnaeus TaxID=1387713 RepID=UPI0033FA9851
MLSGAPDYFAPLTAANATCIICYMDDDETAAAERELTEFRRWADGRDDMVRRARAAGVSKHRIHVLTGIARTTIDRILKEED